MSSTKAKKEAKLKARKTSLSKKTNEELIDIILKKDNTERKNNDKIMNLCKKVEDLEVVVEAKEEQVNIWVKQATDAENAVDEYGEKLNNKIVECDNLKQDYAGLKYEFDSHIKDMKRIKLYKYIIGSLVIVNIIFLSLLIF